jgi:non-specific protein-tyrosine kinase
LDLSSLTLGSSFAQQRVKSYADIINSPLTLNPVIEKLGLKKSAYELAGNIKAYAPTDKVLISVEVTTYDPVLSANIANAVGSQFEITASQLEFGDSTSGIKVTVVADAIPISTPSSPRFLLNSLAGLVLGFLFGLGISIIRMYFSGVVKNSQHLSGLPILTTVGFDKEADEFPLISSLDRYSARTESFRQLRTNIMYEKENKQKSASRSAGFVVTVTSSLPGEGKTTTALNLGISLSAAGKKVIFLEGDLRRPSAKKHFNKLFKLDYTGLSSLLDSKNSTISTYKRLIKRDHDSGLYLILSGPVKSNAGELFTNNQIIKFLNYCRQNFEYVLIDSPPLLPVSDSLGVAKLSDGIILVAQAGVTRIAQFHGTLSRIKQIGGVPLGVVLNMVPEYARDYDDYGYQYEYSRYGYRGYLYRKYIKKYGYDYGYSEQTGYVPKTYPPRFEEKKKLPLWQELSE